MADGGKEQTHEAVNGRLEKSWMPSKSSNIKAYYRTATKTLVLNTTSIELDASLDFETPTLHIYAEKIRLTGDIRLKGKNLGLFCHTLEIQGKARSIDVSGENGRALTETQDDKEGNPGLPGGTLVVYVEDFNNTLIPNRETLPANADQNQLTGLYLYAKGGDGGQGSKKGKGGNAGDGGNIYLYYGHPLSQDYADLKAIQALSGSWKAKVGMLLMRDYAKNIPDEFKNNVKPSVDRFLEAAKFQSGYFATLESTRVTLTAMDNNKTPTDVRSTVKTLLATVKKVAENKDEPILTTDSVTAITAAAKVVGLQADNVASIKAITALNDMLKAINFIPPPPKEKKIPEDQKLTLQYAKQGFENACVNALRRISAQLETDIGFNCAKGKPGSGGQDAEKNSAPNGADAQKEGYAVAREVILSEQAPNLDLEFAIANPNECQMLLNRADDLYFQGYFMRSIDDAIDYFRSARKYYLRLSKRLCFLKSLTDTGGDQKSLMKAYVQLEQDKLTSDPMQMFSSIKSKSDLALHHMMAGQDMFGFNTSWVPRLSFTYYKSRMDVLIQCMIKAEAVMERFKESEDNRIYEFQQSTTVHRYECRAQIDAILDPKGPMKTAANQIASFTGPLKQKRQEVLIAIADLADKIKNSTNTDPKIFIDALCMTAMGPSVFNGVAQGMSAVYTAETTVHATDGTNVNKDYVVSQFKEAGDTIESLEEGYKCRLDGTMEVDDPGAAKLIASEAKIEALVHKFVTDNSLQDSIIKLIKVEYLGLIKSRNNAVLAYNSCVRVYQSLLQDEEFYSHQSGSLGQNVLKMSQDQPTLEFILLKAGNDLRSLCQQTLVFGEKALNYWGLVREHFAPNDKVADQKDKKDGGQNVVDELAVSLIPSSITLDNKADDLLHVFQGCLARYADNPGCTFPDRQTGTTKNLGGIRFWVPKDKLDALKRKHCGLGTTLGPTDTPTPDQARILQYWCDFDIPVATLTTTLEENPFAGRCDVRIDQVRAWLFGAKVGTPASEPFPWLTVELQHYGDPEFFMSPDNRQFTFKHDHVAIQFKYDPTNVKKVSDTLNAPIYEQQKLPQVLTNSTTDIAIDSMAPLGPFTNWRLLVRNSANHELDLTQVDSVCIEFWGTSKLFIEHQEIDAQG